MISIGIGFQPGQYSYPGSRKQPDRPHSARSSEAAGPGGCAAARGERGKLALDLFAPALRALDVAIGVLHPAQLLEAVVALGAAVLVQGHNGSCFCFNRMHKPEAG